VLLQPESASASPQRMALPSMPYAQGDCGVAVAEADPVWQGLAVGVSLALTWQGLGVGVSLPLTWQGLGVGVWLCEGVRVVECEGRRLRVTEAVPVFEACTPGADGVGNGAELLEVAGRQRQARHKYGSWRRTCQHARRDFSPESLAQHATLGVSRGPSPHIAPADLARHSVMRAAATAGIGASGKCSNRAQASPSK
jgi:hypothetical protein